MKKKTIDEVRNILKDEFGYYLIDDVYNNNHSKMNLIDDEGYKYYTALSNLSDKRRARKFDKSNQYTIENIKKWMTINANGYELLSCEYNGNKEKLSFKCPQGHVFNMAWTYFQQGRRCPSCAKRYNDHESFVSLINNMHGNEYSVLGHYVNSNTKILMRHNVCGTEFEALPKHLADGHGCPNRFCCHVRGENHYRWNPNLTDEDRKNNESRLTQYGCKQWRVGVFAKDNSRCVVCGCKRSKNTKIVPHHLDSWDKHVDKRFDVDNGVTLCEFHHKEFHNIYGYGDNTKQQFEEYLSEKIKLQ